MHDFQPGSPPCVHPDHGGAQGQIQEEASGQGCVWGELQWPEFSHHLALPRGHAPVEPAQTPPHEALQVGLGRRAGPGGEGRHQDCRYGVRTGQEEAVRGVWGVRGEGLLVSGFLRQKVVFPAVLASVYCSCWTSGFCHFLSTSSAAGFAWINSQHTCVLLVYYCLCIMMYRCRRRRRCCCKLLWCSASLRVILSMLYGCCHTPVGPCYISPQFYSVQHPARPWAQVCFKVVGLFDNHVYHDSETR